MLVEAVRVFAVATVGGPAARLHVSDAVGLLAKHPQESLGMHRAGAHLHIVGLLKHAAAAGPESLQLEDELLEVGPAAGNFTFYFSFQVRASRRISSSRRVVSLRSIWCSIRSSK